MEFKFTFSVTSCLLNQLKCLLLLPNSSEQVFFLLKSSHFSRDHESIKTATDLVLSSNWRNDLEPITD